MKQVLDVINAYKLAWLWMLGLALIPAATLFLTQTETTSQESWDAMGGFLKFRLYLQCAVAGAAPVFGVLNKSYQRAQDIYDNLKTKRETETEFKTKAAFLHKEEEKKDKQ